jgi:hypothetical protein
MSFVYSTSTMLCDDSFMIDFSLFFVLLYRVGVAVLLAPRLNRDCIYSLPIGIL